MATNIEAKLLSKLQALVVSHLPLANHRNAHGQLKGDAIAACRGWLTSAENAVALACPEDSPYLKSVRKIAEYPTGLMIYENVLEVSAIIKELIADINGGLLASLSNTVRAETFVEFLDHGRSYLNEQRKMEAGVIIGVVFEDTARRLCEKLSISQTGRKLDDLICELQKDGALSPVEAKRARVGAHVRTKATHAQWDEFEPRDVEDTLRITEDLIEKLSS